MRHKTAIATAASVTGVLVASVAALGANVGILNSADESFGDLSASTAGATVTSAAAVAEERLYRIPDIADISVGFDGANVWIVAVEPAAGWSGSSSNGDGAATVELVSATDRLEFRAFADGGEIHTALTRELLEAGDDSADDQTASDSSSVGGTSRDGALTSALQSTSSNSAAAQPRTTHPEDDDAYEDEDDDSYEDEDEPEHEEPEHETEGWDDDD